MTARLVRFVLRIALHAYFRRIDVEGADRVPGEGPVLLVSNHVNGLVDPLFFMAALHRPVTLTAKQSLARNPLLRFLMSLLGVVTFHRREDRDDARGAREANREAMTQASRTLGDGHILCIFPEGKSHNEASLLPFRTGAARIALETAALGRTVAVVPAALYFVSKGRFRSDVWVRFGEPFLVQPGARATGRGTARAEAPVESTDPDAVHDLTHELERRVCALALTFQNRRERFVLEWAAELALTGAREPSGLDRAEEGAARRGLAILELQQKYLALGQSERKAVATLAKRVQAFRHRLRKEGVEPSELFLALDPWAALWFVVREAEILLVGLPLAGCGFVLNVFPALGVRFIARRASRSVDHWAAFAIYPGAVLFPLYYLLGGIAAMVLLPFWWALGLVLLAPFSGAYALLYADRQAGVWRRLATFLRLLLRPRWREALSSEGAALVADIEAARSSVPSSAAAAALLPSPNGGPHVR